MKLNELRTLETDIKQAIEIVIKDYADDLKRDMLKNCQYKLDQELAKIVSHVSLTLMREISFCENSTNLIITITKPELTESK